VAVRNRSAAAFAASGSSPRTRHLGVGAALVEENQPFDFQVILTVKPGKPGALYVFALLLAGMGGLFLTV
jgi:hypothetical protein